MRGVKLAQKFNIFYSWQSDLPSNKTRSFIRNCIDDAIDMALSCDTIEAQRDEATLGTTGSPNIVTTLFSKIDECDLFIADLSLCFTQDQGEKKSPNPNVMLELGYAAKTLGWDRVLCICNTDYGNKYPFDIAHQRITTFSLNGKNRVEVKAELSKIIFKNIRDLRNSTPIARQGMATHVVGAYDSNTHTILNALIPERLDKKELYLNRNEIILQEAKQLLNEIQKRHVQRDDKEIEVHLNTQLAETATISSSQIVLPDAIKKYNESLILSETPVTIPDQESLKKQIELWLDTKIPDALFDLGSLKKRKSAIGVFGTTLEGTDDEKKKYKDICELAYKLMQLDVRKEYLKTFDGMCFMPVAIKNISSIRDTNIRIIIRIDNGEPVDPTENLIAQNLDGLQGRLCRDDDDESDLGIISELFGLLEDGVIHAVGEFNPFIPRIRTPIWTAQGMSYPCKDENDYKEELEDVIASTRGNDFYEFEISSLRPNEICWLNKGMLIKPYDGIIQLKYSIHSDHSDGSIQGTLKWDNR